MRLITTSELSDNLAINFSPKGAWSGLGYMSNIGISANIQIAKNYQLIPEVNLSLSKLSQSNETIALRRLLGDNASLDLFISSAVGLQDLGQLTRSKDLSKGIKINLLY